MLDEYLERKAVVNKDKTRLRMVDAFRLYHIKSTVAVVNSYCTLINYLIN